MASPQIEDMGSISNNQQQLQHFSWYKASSIHIDSQVDVFTKAWVRRNKTAPLGAQTPLSTTTRTVSSPFLQQCANFFHTDNLGFTPTALLSRNEKDHQRSRNILLTNVPVTSYVAVYGFIDHFSNIKDIFKKLISDDITMVILFYDLQQALLCYSSMSQLLQQKPELQKVGLAFIENSMVSSLFDVPLDDLQDTHLFVSLTGKFSKLVAFNYMEMLETIEAVHSFKELEFTESQISIVVEYSDTRIATATHKLLHGKIHLGILFSTYLFTPENESSPPSILKQLTANLQLTPETNISRKLLYGTQHHSHLFGAQGHLEKKTRSVADYSGSYWAPGLSQKIPPHNLCPSSSTSSSSVSSSSSDCSLTPPNSNTPSPTHSTFTGQTLLRPGSSLAVAAHRNAKHRHHHNQRQPQQQQQLDKKLTEMSHPLSAHLLGPLIQELSMIQLDSTGDITESHRNNSTSVPTDDQKYTTDIIAPSSYHSPIDHPTVKRDDNTLNATSQMTTDFDLNRVVNGMDQRTTFMIKNIPNKYDQAMLMEWIDATHKGTYDFLYLRIDFKNKCNVGYAFINFIKVESVISFAEQRQGKQWNRFNSQKICELAYAKIQGKMNLIKKFQNSCVMEQEEAFRPKLFYSSGARQGEEEPFPASKNSDTKTN